MSLAQDQRLLEIQQALSSTHQAVLSQSAAVNCVLQAISRGRRTHVNSIDHPVTYRPASQLELSSNFFPETYTSTSRFPRCYLTITDSYQEILCGDAKINRYSVLFMQSPREWHRLSISIQIHQSSRYWAVTQLAPMNMIVGSRIASFVASGTLPLALHAKLQALLASEELDEDTNLRLVLASGDSIQGDSPVLEIWRRSISKVPSSKYNEAWGFVEDLGCPRFSEYEMAQVTLFDPPLRYISCTAGRMVLEMRDSHLFTELVGVVVDCDQKRLRSYLLAYQKAALSLEHMARVPGISWEQRVMWARQLIEGVAQLHSRGFVAGTLLTNTMPVVVEGSPTIQFWNFRNHFDFGRLEGGRYPPEFRHLKHGPASAAPENCPDVTSKADIYGMGTLLWLLAQDPQPMSDNEASSSSPFYSDPAELPPLSESIPLYYREMVNACRARDPNQRPAARILLARFPHTEAKRPPTARFSISSMDLDETEKSFHRHQFCDVCLRRPVKLPLFHCNVCCTGNYDVCKACFDNGSHCLDSSHLLVEMALSEGIIVPTKYHASLQGNAKRGVIEL